MKGSAVHMLWNRVPKFARQQEGPHRNCLRILEPFVHHQLS